MEAKVTGASPRGASDLKTEAFAHRVIGSTLVLSFPRPVQVMSWAVLNGGFRPRTTHIINHHVQTHSQANDAAKTLRQVVSRLRLRGTVVGMMTGVDVRRYSFARACYQDLLACAIATAGCGNLASVGEVGNYVEGKSEPSCVGTVNLVVVVNYRFTPEAFLEGLEIATEAKVKAMYANGEPATGTGTDCVAVAAGSERRYRFCGKHTKWGELVGRTSLESVRAALRTTLPEDQGHKDATSN
ncbi:MAG: hypothetical protein DMG06_04905 [Acidobacteria bacterium]|nr:MAG: hypothetical protein DMG06_04905 [Acidobacteriota bacterium]